MAMEEDSDLQPLPLPPLLPRAAREPAPARPLAQRLSDGLARAIPLLLMLLLAAGTTWLLRQTAQPETEPSERPARHLPDYEMHGFSMQRHLADGQAPSVIEGREVRHYPDNDTLEIDGVRVRWVDAQGQVTLIQAARAVLLDDRSHARLEGDAVVTRLPLQAGGEAMVFRGDRLDFDNDSQRVSSTQPVQLRQGGQVFDANGLLYEHRDGQLELTGGVRGLLPPRPAAAARTPR